MRLKLSQKYDFQVLIILNPPGKKLKFFQICGSLKSSLNAFHATTPLIILNYNTCHRWNMKHKTPRRDLC